MKRKFKVRGLRRPSPAMIVAVTALFLSLGGVGYAATALPNDSVGNAQLKPSSISASDLRASSVGAAAIKSQAITNTKIQLGAVGYARVNQTEVQLRVTGTCTTAGQAITSVAQTGKVTCASAAPAEFDSGTANNVALTSPTSPATVASYAVPGGSSYLVQASPYITVTPATDDPAGTTDQVTVTCTLAAGTSTSATQTRSVTIDAAAGGGAVHGSLPLMVSEPTNANSSTTDVTCTSSPTTGNAPTVTAASTIYSLQTSSNTSA